MTDRYSAEARADFRVRQDRADRLCPGACRRKGVELLSTGGTAKALREAGLTVRDVADVTGFPEMMDGRVKTLHPAVHGGLLALRDMPRSIMAAACLARDRHDRPAGGEPVSVRGNRRQGRSYDDCIENIDIGGPAMIRAAPRTTPLSPWSWMFRTMPPCWRNWTPMTAPAMAFRQRQAQIAYARTAAYDAAVSNWMAQAIGEDMPRRRAFAGTLAQGLRYGENPHQAAGSMSTARTRPGVATARQWQGKELSYNNINDTDAAFELVAEFDPAEGPAVAIIKHANPCGVARGAPPIEAYRRAYDCDRTSAFGGSSR
jgi:phosphoribosylaminoimidazolecarboxamide formyltransferase/IMP cyclohydrolase